MYEKFYSLNEKPFNITPDPRFLYMGKYHQEALAHLIYGVSERKGFIVLTGEVGAGKTTLIRTLLERLDPSVKTAFIFNPNLTLNGLFLSILEEFELKAVSRTKADFLIELNNFLIERLKKDEHTLLIIDEAQNLPPSILEEIRLLLNLETSKEKLLQIILSGQPELNHKLNLHQLKQLKQRISIRYHLPPLNKVETREYIKERLKIAGSQNSSIFTEKAIEEVFNYSKGIPRLINILCDNSLLTGYATDQQTIDLKIIKESIRDLELEGKNKGIKAAVPSRFSRNPFKRRIWRLSFVLVVISLIFVGYLWWEPGFFENTKLAFPHWLTRLEEKKLSSPIQVRSTTTKRSHVRKIEIPPLVVMAQEASVGGETNFPDLPELLEISDREGPKSSQIITVVKNDILSRIALRRYGRVSERILAYIQKVNPEIRDVNYIEVGQRIVLPELDRDMNLGGIHSDLFSVHVASFKKFADAHALFSQLVREGYEAYLIPVHILQKGQWYRVCLGSFKGKGEASTYAKGLLDRNKFKFARPLYVVKSEAGEIER